MAAAACGSQLPVRHVEKEIGEKHDVPAHLPQFGHAEREFVDAVIEIGAERTARDGGFEVLVRRGDQPDIDRNFAAAAHGTDAPLLQGAEQLHLRFIGQVADLVQKERAAVRGFEGARLVAHGSRKRTLDVAEKLRGGQFAPNRAAVHGYERLSGAPAFAVNQLGHMLLAEAAGTGGFSLPATGTSSASRIFFSSSSGLTGLAT